MQRLLILSSNAERVNQLSSWLGGSFSVGSAGDIPTARAILREDPPLIWLIFVEERLHDLESFWHELRDSSQERVNLRLFVLTERRPSWVHQLDDADEEVLPSPPDNVTVLRNALKELMYRGSSMGTSQELTAEESAMGDTLQRFIGRRMGSALIEKEIGRGAMGAVFSARQVALERRVAIKVMLPALMGDDMAAQRFRREALAIARLKDNHIVQVFEAGFAEDGVFFIVMEFLEGETLDDLLEKRGALPVKEAVGLVKQVCRGLATAHDAGLTHRDIKPSNLMISPDGRITITDFGLVRDTSQIRQTKTNAILGTPAYLAPEQASSSEPDQRTDIYSLGIVLFELLTGHLPFTSDNMVEVLVMHLREPLPDPRRFVADIPEALVQIMNRMTDKNPALRYNNCHELLQAFEQFERDCLSGPSSPRASVMTPRTPAPSGMEITGTMGVTPQPSSLWSAQSISPVPPSQGFSNTGFLTPPGGMSTSNSGLFVSPPTGRPPMAPLDPSLLQVIQHLKVIGMPELEQEQVEGWGFFSMEGQPLQLQGSLAEPWRSFGQTVFRQAASAGAHGLGTWQIASMLRHGQRFLIVPRPDGWGGILLRRPPGSWSGSFQSSTSMMSQAMLADPLQLLISHQDEADTALLFDAAGHPKEQRSKRPQVVVPLQQLLHPIVLGMASWPLEFKELELWFEQSRVLLWRMRNEIWLLLGSLHLLRAQAIGLQQHLIRQFDGEMTVGSESSMLWAQHSGSLQLSQSGGMSQSAPFAQNAALSQSAPVHSGAWADVSFQSLEPVSNPLSQEVVEALQKAFARFVGPMAKVALQKTARKLGHSRKEFPSAKAQQLLDSLANQLDEDKRQTFLKEARALLPPEATR